MSVTPFQPLSPFFDAYQTVVLEREFRQELPPCECQVPLVAGLATGQPCGNPSVGMALCRCTTKQDSAQVRLCEGHVNAIRSGKVACSTHHPARVELVALS